MYIFGKANTHIRGFIAHYHVYTGNSCIHTTEDASEKHSCPLGHDANCATNTIDAGYSLSDVDIGEDKTSLGVKCEYKIATETVKPHIDVPPVDREKSNTKCFDAAEFVINRTDDPTNTTLASSEKGHVHTVGGNAHPDILKSDNHHAPGNTNEDDSVAGACDSAEEDENKCNKVDPASRPIKLKPDL